MLELPVEPKRGGGGFNKPISVRQFILDYLAQNGEAPASGIHQAYKQELKRLGDERIPKKSGERGRNPTRGKRYKIGTLYSFTRVMQALRQEGVIRVEREELSTSSRTEYWVEKPLRQVYKLVV